MNLKEKPIERVNELQFIEGGLMLPEQAAYYLAWHELIGDRSKVIYNAMGPDISSALLMYNPDQIVGIDTMCFGDDQSHEYADIYWNTIDQRLFVSPSMRETDHLGLRWHHSDDEIEQMFREDLVLRKKRGYYDQAAVHRWGIDRLLIMELKRLGVQPESISLTEIANHRNDGFHAVELDFDWDYPGQRLKTRKLIFADGLSLDGLLQTKAKARFKNTDVFHQKGLPDSKLQIPYLRLVLPYLNKEAWVSMGLRMKMQESGEVYLQKIKETLGNRFSQQVIDPMFEELIDALPEDEPDYDCVKYGMKLHVFTR